MQRVQARTNDEEAMRVQFVALITMGMWLGGCAAPPAPSTGTPAVAPRAATAPATVPAGPARATLANAGFESTRPGHRGDPEGWFSFQHAGPLSYKYTVDATERRSGERSLRIDNTGPEIYGAIAQGVDARPWKGKDARLTAWVKTRGADDNGVVLTLLALQSGATVAQNFMPDAPIKGTTDWKRYTIMLPLPSSTDKLEVGMMLRGRGSAWLDDVELEILTP
jgi:hypothetical protein